MISPQPIFSLKYFRLRKNKIPKNIKCLFYLSWEDAFWDILLHKNIKLGSYILVPDFYCNDVEKNIKLHGYKLAYYKINRDLTANKKSFKSVISKLKPAVVVIFHAVGIKNNLLDNPKWLMRTVGDSILIEDAVHRVQDANDIKIYKKNHFVIDSLRKVVPIQGSRLFGKTEDLNFKIPNIFQSLPYSFKVNFFWFLTTLCWTLNFQKSAERLMIKSYSLIGDSILPARGLALGKFFSDRLNISFIQKMKRQQVNYYESNLKDIIPANLKIINKDKKHLRGYPLILPVNYANEILSYLRNNGLMVRFELNDSSWSQKQKIIYLPLGPYLKLKNLIDIVSLVVKSLQDEQ